MSTDTATKETKQVNFKPLGDRVLVKRFEPETETAGGLELPDTAQEKPQQGEVIKVGPGRLEEGVRVPMDLEVGNKVLFAKYAGAEVKVDGEDYLVIPERDILGVFG